MLAQTEGIFMELSKSCPICKSVSLPHFYAGEHRMFQCNRCFLAFVDPMPSKQYLDDFYSRFHMELCEGGGYELIEDRMNADFLAKIAKVRLALPDKDSRLLDVGCGKGFFVKACLDSGIQASEIDLSDTAIEFAKTELGLDAIQGKIEDLYESIGTYDAVTLWATIEHLRDPVETLSAIKKVLKPGGLLFLDTGIGNDWLDILLPGCVQWYDPPQHLFVFSEESISILLSKVGFTVEDVDTCFERSKMRRYARMLRGILCATGLRVVAELTRTKHRGAPFQFTRFSLGNLISIVARVDTRT